MRRRTAMMLVGAMISMSARAGLAPAPGEPELDSSSMRPLILSQDLPMLAGVETLVTLYQGLGIAEDKILRLRRSDEAAPAKKLASRAVRFAKLGLFDLPLAHLTVVTAHEHLGHGARYREFEVPGVHYRVDLPPPYGAGGGEASASIAPHSTADDPLLAIWLGGVESQWILNRNLALQWAIPRRVSYQDAALYFQSWRLTQEWFDGTSRYLGPGAQESDLNAWTRLVNERAGVAAGATRRVTVEDVQSQARLNWLNPMLFVSLYTMAKTYVWDGRESGGLPMIRIGHARYLPAARIGLTPFGVDYHLENFFHLGPRALRVDLRVGDSALYRDWGGVGVQVRNLVATDRFGLDASVDVWRQPGLRLSEARTRLSGDGPGAAATLRAYLTSSRWATHGSILIELGYKTPGYLEGWPLAATPHVALGFAFRR